MRSVPPENRPMIVLREPALARILSQIRDASSSDDTCCRSGIIPTRILRRASVPRLRGLELRLKTPVDRGVRLAR